MILLSKNFINNLNLYNGSLRNNGRDIAYDFSLFTDITVFSIWFNLKEHTAKISDLFGIKDWSLIKEDLKEEDIQPLIDKYYKTYSNLKAFY